MTVPPAEAIGKRPILDRAPTVRKPESVGSRLGYRAAEIVINNVLSRVLFTTQSDPNSAKPADGKKPAGEPAGKDDDANKKVDPAVLAHRRLVLFEAPRRSARTRASIMRRGR